MYRGCGLSAVDTVASGLAEVYFNPFVVDVVVDGTGGVRPSTDTSHQVVRIIASFFFQELFLDFTADDALQAGHHVG